MLTGATPRATRSRSRSSSSGTRHAVRCRACAYLHAGRRLLRARRVPVRDARRTRELGPGDGGHRRSPRSTTRRCSAPTPRRSATRARCRRTSRRARCAERRAASSTAIRTCRAYDLADYDVQAVGEVIASKSTTDDFEVQARFAPVPDLRTVSIAVAVALRVAGHRVTIYRTPTGVRRSHRRRADDGSVRRSRCPAAARSARTATTDRSIVVWPDGSVGTSRSSEPSVCPPYYRFLRRGRPRRPHTSRASLGNADGDSRPTTSSTRDGADRIPFPDPPFASSTARYADSWRISQAESLFDYGPGQTTDTFTDLTFPDAPATRQTLPPACRAARDDAVRSVRHRRRRGARRLHRRRRRHGRPGFRVELGRGARRPPTACRTTPAETTIGTPTTVTIGTAGENAVRTFAATAGQKLTLTVSGNTIAGVGSHGPRIRTAATSRRCHALGADGVPRRVHAAGDRHVHDHGRSARPEHGHADVHARARCRTTRARRRSARRRR